MSHDLSKICEIDKPITLIFCAGFEQRVGRAPAMLSKLGVEAKDVLILNYLGKEHEANLKLLRSISKRLTRGAVTEIGAFASSELESYLRKLNPSVDVVARRAGARFSTSAITNRKRS
jgi:hypothetical protein